MKKYILTFMVLVMSVWPAQADDLADLLYKFNQRIGEVDTATTLLPDTAKMIFLDLAQDKVVRFGGMLPKRTDITYASDSAKYKLPADFKSLDPVNGVMIYVGDEWKQGFYNPGFRKDTAATVYEYFCAWEHSGQAELYARGGSFYDGQTIRVFYLAKAPNMRARGDSCYVPEDLQVFIIEEAISYYEEAKRNLAGFQLMNQVVRQDMGINLPQKE